MILHISKNNKYFILNFLNKKFIFLFCILVSMSVYSQNSLEEMKEPYVKVIGNKFIIENYTLYTDKTNSNSFQVKVKAEAPKDLIHLVSSSEMLVVSSLLNDAKIDIENVKLRTLKKPIGQVNLEIRFILTEEGVQTSFIDANGEKIFVHTSTWKEFFEQ